MTAISGEFPPAYLAMLQRDGHQNPPAFAHALANLFEGTDLSGKRVLEIGSGRGLVAVYMGLQGAAHVLSMEPELVGATFGVIEDQRSRIATLGLRNVELEVANFNTWDPAGRRFDVIVSRASINHLHESNQHAEHHRPTYDAYVHVTSRIHQMLAPGGTFIATDACRYAFFTAVRHIGIRRPWRWKRSGVDWRYHQNPGTWMRIFKDAGFSRSSVDYPVPYRLRMMGPVVNTAAANFFLSGSFILRADQ